MFVSILLSAQRAAQVDDVIREFRTVAEPIRDLEIRKSGSRGVYFIFKADGIEPFQEFAKGIGKKLECVKDGIEFAWDDGVFRQAFVYDGELVVEEDYRSNHLSSAWIFLESFTQIRDDFKRLMKAWEAEIKPSAEQSKQKLADLEKGKAEWDRQFEERSKRSQRRVESSGDPAGISGEQETAKIVKRLPRTRREILDEMSRINTSGFALVPFVVFANELAKSLNPAGMAAFASWFDKSKQKAEIFGLVKDAFEDYRKRI